MKSKYEIIEELHRRARESGDAEVLKAIPGLLVSWCIKLRTDDGELYQVNLSNPEQGIFVVGLRYKKKDGSLTEDIFEFDASSPNEISKYCKGRYERERKEYGGTHKQENVSLSPFTSVNTCSLYTWNEK